MPAGFYEVKPFARRAVCARCAAIILDDDEHANRGWHEAFHEQIDELTEQLGRVVALQVAAEKDR